MPMSTAFQERLFHRLPDIIDCFGTPFHLLDERGSLPSSDGTHSLYCAVIVKRVDEKTLAKTSLNELLREAEEAD